MADDEAKGAKFLMKSKWGRIFKEDDSGKSAFKLNDDVIDFLKPSTDKSMPKLDVAIAQRWPDAHQVRLAADASPLAQAPSYTRPKRRKGLVVTFSTDKPAVIGEGGEEAIDPTQEISRRKASMSRSFSDRKPSRGEGNSWAQGQAMPGGAPPTGQGQDRTPPHALRRTMTSHNETSPALQRKHASPPYETQGSSRPGFGRGQSDYAAFTPGSTAVGSDAALNNQRKMSESGAQVPSIHVARSRPHLDRDMSAASRPAPGSDYLNSKPIRDGPNAQGSGFLNPPTRSGVSPVARKQREMMNNEGMAFRRASAMIMQQESDDEDESDQTDVTTNRQNANQGSTSTSRPPPLGQPRPDFLVSQTQVPLTPESEYSVDGPSPFVDPKYTERHSEETTPAPSTKNFLPAPPSGGRGWPTSGPTGAERTQQGFVAFSPSTENKVTQPYPQTASRPMNGTLNGVQQARSPNYPVGGPAEKSKYTEPPRTQGNALPAALKPAPEQGRLPMPDQTSLMSLSAALRGNNVDTSQETRKPAAAKPSPVKDSLDLPQPAPNDYISGPPRKLSNATQLQPPGSLPVMDAGLQSRASPAALRPRGNSAVQNPISQAKQESTERFMSNSNSPMAGGRIPAECPGSDRPFSPLPGEAPLPYQPATRPNYEIGAAAEAAYADFTSRVAHMRGVFRLTAQKEKPSEQCTPNTWLRAALWWHLRGKTGMETLLQQRGPQGNGQELLTQAHVDMAKVWWILAEPLEDLDVLVTPSAGVGMDEGVAQSPGYLKTVLQQHLKHLVLSASKTNLMPPTQSLIQGQDTTIWLNYPSLTPDALYTLNRKDVHSQNSAISADPFLNLPLSDTKDYFIYGRFLTECSLHDERSEAKPPTFTCFLSLIRGRKEMQTSFIIASQNETVNIRVWPKPGEDKSALSWRDVSWKASSFGMAIHLRHGCDLVVRMQERDFRMFWRMAEYARNIERSLRAGEDEVLVYETRLVELQYADSSKTTSFPTEKVKGPTVKIFKVNVSQPAAGGLRLLHRGFRMVIVTDPALKTLSSAQHELGQSLPFFFELMTDPAAHGTTAMVMRMREEKRQFRILLVFHDATSRQNLYDIVNGLDITPDERVMGEMSLAALNMEAAALAQGFAAAGHPALQSLEWQKLSVTNGQSPESHSRVSWTVQSENLRILARHSTGCITDRVNLGKGELLLRLPCANTPVVQLYRAPQEDISLAVDTRNAPPAIAEGLAHLLHVVRKQATIRTFTFASLDDLHAFQFALTNHTVRYDGLAASFGISRRRMVVPIYKKLEAAHVRLQVVAKDSVVQVVAFFEEFDHADALVFQVKSTDTFEEIKGDGRNKKWAVKLVDAKFSLPSGEDKAAEPVTGEERVKRRFVNLENLEYMGEHDDITIGFDTEQERNLFGHALPSATSVSRGITLRRRI